jgi:LacI family transcriptional regulator
VLLAPASSDGAPVQALLRQNVGVVVIDRRVEGVAVDTVRGDSQGGAYQLVRHLTELGHRRIALLGGPPDLSVSRDRAAGYAQALCEVGLPVDPALQLFGAFTVESGRRMMQALLALPVRPTAIFAASNFIAAGALQALRSAGLRTPDDLSVVVFDDLPDPYVSAPSLTVVAQPAYALGQTAARRLLAKISQPDQDDICDLMLPVRMLVRQSTRAPKPDGELMERLAAASG